MSSPRRAFIAPMADDCIDPGVRSAVAPVPNRQVQKYKYWPSPFIDCYKIMLLKQISSLKITNLFDMKK